MTIHHPEAEFLDTVGAAGAVRHALADLRVDALARRFVVFTPSGAVLDAMVRDGERDIGGVASVETVRRVASHNPDSLWAIARRSRFDAGNPVAEGFFAFLMLNREGLKALVNGTFDGSHPDIGLLAPQHEKPAAIYSWAVRAPKGLAAAVPLVLEKMSTPSYRDVDIFSHSTTEDGIKFVEAIGFRRGVVVDGVPLPHLHWMERAPRPAPRRPLYDSYAGPETGESISVTTVRKIEDLLRVFSVRSAVYMAEQACPYEEEYDGNDFCATHLLGYVGDEPAGCMRVRCFADFAKLERVAIRKEFRNSRLVHKLIRAAIALCCTKGYSKLYGHPRNDLLRFYSHFGFKSFPGAKTFRFSGVDYSEVVLDIGPDSDAVAIGADPYVLIRPEGQWHVPGILERSAQRPPPASSVGQNRA